MSNFYKISSKNNSSMYYSKEGSKLAQGDESV